MHEIDLSAVDLVAALLELSKGEIVCLLDSCGVGHGGSHLLIAGVDPVEVFEIEGDKPKETLAFLDDKLESKTLASIFSISYDFGARIQGLNPPATDHPVAEPDVFVAQFDCLVIHDYDSARSYVVGNSTKFDEVERKLASATRKVEGYSAITRSIAVNSNFTKAEYLATIQQIQESIRSGDTYQTNLTQQLQVELPSNRTPQDVFLRLRSDHPAPFAAFLKRVDSTVVSASPERFFRIDAKDGSRTIRTSPIKGTRPRGKTPEEDAHLREELLKSEKEIAENTMIVDLLRNDLGRVCEFGRVKVEKLCDLEEHPSLFHLVSTISGDLCQDARFSDILRAMFPCGSITGAPKISTMKIIDCLEPANRGLSMGAIGYYLPTSPRSKFQGPKSREGEAISTSDFGPGTLDSILDLSVAIRTMVVRNQTATFNVGGGIVIDSDPDGEYDESLLKAQALLRAIGSSFEFQL